MSRIKIPTESAHSYFLKIRDQNRMYQTTTEVYSQGDGFAAYVAEKYAGAKQAEGNAKVPA